MVTLKGRPVILAAVAAGFAFLAFSSSVTARQHEQHGGAPPAPKADAPAQGMAGCPMMKMQMGGQAPSADVKPGAAMPCMAMMRGMANMPGMANAPGMQHDMPGMPPGAMQGMGNMGCMGMGRMMGMGPMRGMAMGGNAPAAGMAMDATAGADMELFHFLAGHGTEIRRTIKELPNGVDTVTESDNAEVASKLQVHVAAMTARLDDKRGIHLRDPLFVEVFKNADKIVVKQEPTTKGIRVVETSSDPYVAKLIKAHAQVVTGFIKNGHAEMMKDHELPAR